MARQRRALALRKRVKGDAGMPPVRKGERGDENILNWLRQVEPGGDHDTQQLNTHGQLKPVKGRHNPELNPHNISQFHRPNAVERLSYSGRLYGEIQAMPTPECLGIMAVDRSFLTEVRKETSKSKRGVKGHADKISINIGPTKLLPGMKKGSRVSFELQWSDERRTVLAVALQLRSKRYRGTINSTPSLHEFGEIRISGSENGRRVRGLGDAFCDALAPGMKRLDKVTFELRSCRMADGSDNLLAVMLEFP